MGGEMDGQMFEWKRMAVSWTTQSMLVEGPLLLSQIIPAILQHLHQGPDQQAF